jgi:hypothetical protein
MYDIERMTDLTPGNLASLQQIGRGDIREVHPLALKQFVQDGLVEAAGNSYKLTRHAQELLQRVAALKAGEWAPAVALPAEALEILSSKQGFRVAWRIEKHLGVNVSGDTVKVLLHLARSPCSYRWLCRIFGKESLQPPLAAGLVDGKEQRGSLWPLSAAGKDLLQRTLPCLDGPPPGDPPSPFPIIQIQSSGGPQTMLTLSRVNLFEALKNGASACGGTLPSGKFARLEARAADRLVMITTFNGATAIESVLPGDVADDMLALVDAQTLLHLVAAMPEGAISLALKNNRLVMTTGDGKYKNDLKVGGPEIEIPVISGSSKTRLARISGVDFQCLGRAVKFALAAEGEPKLMSVNVAFNQYGERVLAVASATDGFSACQSLAALISCEKSAVGKSIAFPASILTQMLQIIRPDDEVEICRSGKTRYIISATNEKTGKNLALASSEASAPAPAEPIARIIQTTKDQGDVSMEVDTASLASALEIITAFSTREEPASMRLSVRDGAIQYASDPTGSGQCQPSTLDGTATGPAACRWFEPSFIRKVVGVMPEKTRAVLPSKPLRPILFIGDNIRVTVAPKSTQALEAVKFDEPVAIELPAEQPVVEAVA